MSQTSSLRRHFRAQARPRSCITSPSSGIAAYLPPHPQHLSFPTASLTTLLSRNFPPLRNGLFSAVIWAGWVRFCHQSASWTDCIRLVIRFVQPRFQPAKPPTHPTAQNNQQSLHSEKFPAQKSATAAKAWRNLAAGWCGSDRRGGAARRCRRVFPCWARCGGGCACAATRARRNPSPPCCNGDTFRGQRDGQREKSLQKVSLSYVKTVKARSEARDLDSSSLWPRSCIVP